VLVIGGGISGALIGRRLLQEGMPESSRSTAEERGCSHR